RERGAASRSLTVAARISHRSAQLRRGIRRPRGPRPTGVLARRQLMINEEFLRIGLTIAPRCPTIDGGWGYPDSHNCLPFLFGGVSCPVFTLIFSAGARSRSLNSWW